MSVLLLRSYQHNAPSGATLGTLTQAFDKWAQLEDNADSGGGFTINRHDSQAAWCDPGNYIRGWIDSITGDADFGFWLEDGGHEDVSLDEQGGQEWRFAGRGPIATLAEGLVWHRETTASYGRVQGGEWRFDDEHPAGVLARLVDEAKTRGCFPHVTYDFTRTLDSSGVAWASAKARDWRVPIGEDLLTVVGELRETGLHVLMTPEFVLRAWDSRGTDRSATISFVHGVNIRDAGERQSQPAQAASVALMEGQSERASMRYKAVRDATIETAIGRRKERHVRYPRTATRAILKRIGDRRLARWKRIHDGPPGLGVIDTSGKTALTDYSEGDTVEVDIPDAIDNVGHRIACITLADRTGPAGSGEYDVTLEFGELSTGGSSYISTGDGRDGSPGGSGSGGKPGDGSGTGGGRDGRPGTGGNGGTGSSGNGTDNGGCGCGVDMNEYLLDDFLRTAGESLGSILTSSANGGSWWEGGNAWMVQTPDVGTWGLDPTTGFFITAGLLNALLYDDNLVATQNVGPLLPVELPSWSIRVAFRTSVVEVKDNYFGIQWKRDGDRADFSVVFGTAIVPTRIAAGATATNKTILANTWYWVRFEVDGTIQNARLWADGTDEPTTWDASAALTTTTDPDTFLPFFNLGSAATARLDYRNMYARGKAESGELVTGRSIPHGSAGVIDVGEAFMPGTLTVVVDDQKVTPSSQTPASGTADLGAALYHDPVNHPAGCAQVVVSYRRA